VQVQSSQESACWDVYQEIIDAIVQYEVEKLPDAIQQAIWLQTDEGCGWEPDEDGQKEPPFNTEAITSYVHDIVLAKADDWTNRRITKKGVSPWLAQPLHVVVAWLSASGVGNQLLVW
jgi:hypothetical protein